MNACCSRDALRYGEPVFRLYYDTLTFFSESARLAWTASWSALLLAVAMEETSKLALARRISRLRGHGSEVVSVLGVGTLEMMFRLGFCELGLAFVKFLALQRTTIL